MRGKIQRSLQNLNSCNLLDAQVKKGLLLPAGTVGYSGPHVSVGGTDCQCQTCGEGIHQDNQSKRKSILTVKLLFKVERISSQ